MPRGVPGGVHHPDAPGEGHHLAVGQLLADRYRLVLRLRQQPEQLADAGGRVPVGLAAGTDVGRVVRVHVDRSSGLPGHVRRATRDVHLGPTEYRLLEYLMRHPGRVYSREQLLDGVWGQDVYIDERTVDVHVGRLRKALNRPRQPDPIRTVRGSGYSFNEMFARAH